MKSQLCLFSATHLLIRFCSLALLVLGVNAAKAELRGSNGSVGVSAPPAYSVMPVEPEPAPLSPAAQAGVDLGADIVPLELDSLDLAVITIEDQNTPQTPMRVGIQRPLGILSTDALAAIYAAPGLGSFWSLDIHSPEARGLRLKFANVDLPEGAELWIYSPSDPAQIDGPYTNQGAADSGVIWTKIIPGDTLRVECFVPESASTDAGFVIEEVSHIYRGLGEPSPVDGGGVTLGDCYLDVLCYPAWHPLHNATAHIFFTEGSGTYLCSGTLLNTVAGDQTPYFMTANHCVSTDTVGATVTAYWFYQTSSCNGANASYYQSSYADVLWTSSGYDISLLMFEGRLFAGTSWSGWDTNNVTNGTAVAGISHPGGRRKKISFGTKINHPWGDTTRYVGVNWTDGTIEGGSSGSGLYRVSNQNFVGVASHSASPMGCDNPQGPSGYGRFSGIYNSISSYLQAGSDDSFFGNQSCATAQLIGPGAYSNLVIKHIASDWFRIVLNPCEELSLTMSHTNAWGDLDLRFYDACGGNLLLERVGAANNKNFTYVNEDSVPHVYYLHVFLGDNDTRNTYSLTVAVANLSAPLATPTNVQASDGTYCDEVRVTWNAVSGATSYSIWRSLTNNPAGAAQIGSSATTAYTDATTSDNVTYYYWVKAHNEQPCTDSAFSASNAGYSYCDVPCPGDLNGDGYINISDLAQLLGNYGLGAGATYEHGDLDGDGDVDLSDLAALLSLYGTPCP